MRAAVLTVSDGVAAGDAGGHAAATCWQSGPQAAGFELVERRVVADERDRSPRRCAS